MNVYIIETPSDNPEMFNDAYKTIAIGFPTSSIIRYNNSNKELHHNIIKHLIKSNDVPFVICDSDVIFYDSIEDKLDTIKDCLLAGRFIPNYYNEVLECNEAKRFHTSLLYFPQPQKLLEYINTLPQHPNYPLNIFDPFQYFLNQTRFFYDTGANLYHSIPQEQSLAFRPDHLDCYSHIGSGTIYNIVGPKLANKNRLLMQHKIAKTEPHLLRYLWKEQELYYKSHPPRFNSI